MDGLNQTLIGLERAIRDLACEIKHQNDNHKILFRIEQLEDKITMKISELGNTVDALRAKVVKISDEQQKQYDALVVKYAALQKQLEDAELTEEVAAKVTEFGLELDRFDDKIPDFTTQV